MGKRLSMVLPGQKLHIVIVMLFVFGIVIIVDGQIVIINDCEA